MVEALDVDAIQKAWNDYFVFLGIEQVKRGDEAEAVAESQRLTSEAEIKRTKAIADAERAFDGKKKAIEAKHAEVVGLIEEDAGLARDIAQKAAQDTKDHQDKSEKALGVRPHIPQGAAPSGARRVSL